MLLVIEVTFDSMVAISLSLRLSLANLIFSSLRKERYFSQSDFLVAGQ
jgi:hypothetical protein